jgi:hypothetical protein
LQKTPSVEAFIFGTGKECSAHEHIDDLLPDALRKRGEQLILASKRSWAKWLRNGKGLLRRRRVKKMNAIFAVPRQTPATNEPSEVLRPRRLRRRRVRTERTPSAEGRRTKGAWGSRGTVDAATEAAISTPWFENARPRCRIHRCSSLSVASYTGPRRSIRSSASITQTPHSRQA